MRILLALRALYQLLPPTGPTPLPLGLLEFGLPGATPSVQRMSSRSETLWEDCAGDRGCD